MANSLAACLQSVGFEMPRVHDVAPLLDVDGVVEALTARLQSTGSGRLHCPCAAPTQGVVACPFEQWFKPYSPHKGIREFCKCFVAEHFAVFSTRSSTKSAIYAFRLVNKFCTYTVHNSICTAIRCRCP